MKSKIFVRPNLKGFALAAVIVALLQHLLAEGQPESQWLLRVSTANARELGDGDLRELTRAAAETQSAELFRRLSILCEQRDDFRRALYFMREADRLSHTEDY